MNPILSQSTVSQFAPLQTIYAPVWDALERVDQEYLRQIEGERGMIQEIGRHLAEGRGKFLRPALVLLSAAHSGGADDALRVKLGVVVELIHVASLIHDDVMDHAALRRKQVTLNSRWGDEASVICGDILYSKAFKLLVDIGVPDVMQTVARSTMVMCSGQLAELERRQDLGLQREGYLDIIIQKTARLISDCCRSGAQLAGAHPSVVNALAGYGMKLGIAFQIVDDCLDYVGETEVMGKPPGTDLREGKVTLPLIMYLDSLAKEEKTQLLAQFFSEDRKACESLRRQVVESGVVDKCLAQARQFAEEAKEQLNGLPGTEPAQRLHTLAGYVVARKV